MNLPKPKKINAEKYVAGLSLFKKKTANIKMSANDEYTCTLGPSPKAIKEFNKVSKNLKNLAHQVRKGHVLYLDYFRVRNIRS